MEELHGHNNRGEQEHKDRPYDPEETAEELARLKAELDIAERKTIASGGQPIEVPRTSFGNFANLFADGSKEDSNKDK
jgi:hypothetical protein